MRIDEILIGPAVRDGRKCNVLHLECAGYKFTGYFEPGMDSFLTCVSEAAQFFAIKTGRMNAAAQTLTRPVLNG